MAVGFRENTKTGKYRTLVESWDGQRWVTNVSPNRGSVRNVLNSVSCISGNFCTAVGFSGGKPTAGLVETWDGTSWTIANGAQVPNNALSGVSCVSASFCVAVGYEKIPAQPHQRGQYQTLAEVWDGSTWAVVPSPDPGSEENYLYGVACSSVDFCAAVGSTLAGAHSPIQPLTEVWNGTSWSLASSPDAGPENTWLFGVSCTSPSSCTTVGWVDQTDPLVESWDGSSWTIVTTPNVGQALLDAVSCTARDTCTAVGYTLGSSYRTLVESWNGLVWRVVASPDKVGPSNVLGGVSCLATGACTAVGGHYNSPSYIYRTLVEASN